AAGRDQQHHAERRQRLVEAPPHRRPGHSLTAVAEPEGAEGEQGEQRRGRPGGDGPAPAPAGSRHEVTCGGTPMMRGRVDGARGGGGGGSGGSPAAVVRGGPR